MTWTDLPLRPPDRVLRQFAGLWLAFFGALAAWQYFGRHDRVAAVVLAALAITVGPMGLVKPTAVRPIFIAWMVLAYPVGWLVSAALLALTYYGVFTPVGLAFRLVGRDALRLRARPGADSYWTTRPQVTDPRRYFRQF
jgi:Saxitoxin biosynthesis operon protein SxtJ